MLTSQCFCMCSPPGQKRKFMSDSDSAPPLPLAKHMTCDTDALLLWCWLTAYRLPETFHPSLLIYICQYGHRFSDEKIETIAHWACIIIFEKQQKENVNFFRTNRNRNVSDAHWHEDEIHSQAFHSQLRPPSLKK